MAEIIMIIGSIIILVGCVGFIRFNNFHARVQVVVKSVPFGIAVILFGVFIKLGFDEMGIRALIAVIFLWFLVPIIGYAISSSAKQTQNGTQN
ncbi:MAG: monovalent cation/H(+) antiporter subunit G [Elusimicrobiota bacterium]|nr:monovalent cation/H(+) antiporter subunit G [Elusimicrobiota bacterium]